MFDGHNIEKHGRKIPERVRPRKTEVLAAMTPEEICDLVGISRAGNFVAAIRAVRTGTATVPQRQIVDFLERSMVVEILEDMESEGSA